MILKELTVSQKIEREVFKIDPSQTDRLHDSVLQAFSARICRIKICRCSGPVYKIRFFYHNDRKTFEKHVAQTKRPTIVGIYESIITYNCSVKNNCR